RYTLLDGDSVQPGLRVREPRIQSLERFAQKPTDRQVAIPLAVRRDDMPGGGPGIAQAQRVLVRRLVRVPQLALGDVLLVELPVLRRVVKPGLEPGALFVLADV